MKSFLPVFSIVGIASTIIGVCLAPVFFFILFMMGDVNEPTLGTIFQSALQFLVLPYLVLVLSSWGLKLLSFHLSKPIKWGIIAVILIPFFALIHYRYLYYNLFYFISALASSWLIVEVFYEKSLKMSSRMHIFFGSLPIGLLLIFLIGYSLH